MRRRDYHRRSEFSGPELVLNRLEALALLRAADLCFRLNSWVIVCLVFSQLVVTSSIVPVLMKTLLFVLKLDLYSLNERWPRLEKLLGFSIQKKKKKNTAHSIIGSIAYLLSKDGFLK